jgi:acyl carrier protein
MTPQETTIADIVADVCSNVTVSDADRETPLKDLGVDSLDIASIFLAIQEQLGVRVPDAKIDELTTVQKIAAYIEANRS